jgi:hypothetical protein
VPASSSHVSQPTPSLDLPDVADLFAPPSLQSLQSRATDSSSRDNASRKRESNGSLFQDSQSKFPRTQSQPRGARNVAGNSLIPPQLRGRLVLFLLYSGVMAWDQFSIVGVFFNLYSNQPLFTDMGTCVQSKNVLSIPQ